MLTLFFLLSLGAGNAQEKTEAEQLEGRWTLTASSRGDKGTLFVIDGKRFRAHNKAGEVEAEGTFITTLDKGTKQIDLFVERKGEVYTMRGIYVLEGKTLKMAYHAVRENSVRPTDFKGEGKDVRIMVYERAK
jgi:uncharacterized protein (TIGR03067 family)